MSTVMPGTRQTAPLTMWVVFDHPKDCPDYFIARQWLNGAPGDNTVMSSSLDSIREIMRQMSLTKVERDPSDDPVILETWL